MRTQTAKHRKNRSLYVKVIYRALSQCRFEVQDKFKIWRLWEARIGDVLNLAYKLTVGVSRATLFFV